MPQQNCGTLPITLSKIKKRICTISFGKMVEMIKYKAKEYGIKVEVVD
ncbi:MAG: hypothetical protein DRP24_05630 [Thermotoga sp.]|nr:MAG: hypothetical protein DRP24_05630 [Thermotoga sp.]